MRRCLFVHYIKFIFRFIISFEKIAGGTFNNKRLAKDVREAYKISSIELIRPHIRFSYS